MKVEGTLFATLAVFLFGAAIVYGVWAGEPVGATCIALSGGLSTIIGGYLLFTARRMEARPEDREDAEISEGSGEVGFFPPHSWWPLALGATFSLTTVGLIIGPFLLIIGFALLVIAICGFVFEYYVGVNASQGQTLGALDAAGQPAARELPFLGHGPH